MVVVFKAFPFWSAGAGGAEGGRLRRWGGGLARDGEVLADDVGDRLFVAREQCGGGAVDGVDGQRRRGRLAEEAGDGDDPAVEGADPALGLGDVVDLEDA